MLTKGNGALRKKGVIFLLVILSSLGCDAQDEEVTVIVSNHTEDSIPWISISVYGESYIVRDLDPSSDYSFRYFPSYETSYRIEWTDGLGARSTERVGYISRGWNMYDEIVITSDGIKYSMKQRRFQ